MFLCLSDGGLWLGNKGSLPCLAVWHMTFGQVATSLGVPVSNSGVRIVLQSLLTFLR